MGTSFKLFDGFYLGANFKYLFGSIDLSRSVAFPAEYGHSYTEIESRTIVNDFLLDLGIQYSYDFRENSNVTLGVIFDNKTKVSAEYRVLKKNSFPGSATPINDSTILDPIFTIDETSKVGNIVIPTNLGIGISYNYANKIKFGVDYYQQDWTNSTFFNEDEPLTKSNSIHGGLEIIPNPEALKGYLNFIALRLGGHYQNSYLRIQGEQLKDYGMSFGLGLPLRNGKSSFNLACELGRRGEKSLIRENYVFLSFSVTLYDFWFVQRKYD